MPYPAPFLKPAFRGSMSRADAPQSGSLLDERLGLIWLKFRLAFIAEQFVPVAEIFVAGQNDAAVLIAFRHQPEEKFGLLAV
jgi:hypothetical protein